MMHRPVLLVLSDAATVGDALARFGYDSVAACDPIEALARLRADSSIGVIVADADAGGLALARDARAIRPDLGVVYTALVPQRIPDNAKVSGAPVLRIPYRADQLAALIAGLGRRVLDDPLAA